MLSPSDLALAITFSLVFGVALVFLWYYCCHKKFYYEPVSYEYNMKVDMDHRAVLPHDEVMEHHPHVPAARQESWWQAHDWDDYERQWGQQWQAADGTPLPSARKTTKRNWTELIELDSQRDPMNAETTAPSMALMSGAHFYDDTWERSSFHMDIEYDDPWLEGDPFTSSMTENANMSSVDLSDIMHNYMYSDSMGEGTGQFIENDTQLPTRSSPIPQSIARRASADSTSGYAQQKQQAPEFQQDTTRETYAFLLRDAHPSALYDQSSEQGASDMHSVVPRVAAKRTPSLTMNARRGSRDSGGSRQASLGALGSSIAHLYAEGEDPLSM